ncbi:MAG: hypothetical protein KGZ39_08185 [Simkania sp.]|nr:hypothetical protein [Simkania sp.]
MSITLEEINTIRRAFHPEELSRAPKEATDLKQSECIPLRLAQASMESLESKKAELSLYSKERFWQSILDYAETELKITETIFSVLSVRKGSDAQIVYQKSLTSLEGKIKALLKKIQISSLTQTEEDALIAQVTRYRQIKALLFLNPPAAASAKKSPLQQQAEQKWSDCIITAKKNLDEIHKNPTFATSMKDREQPDSIDLSSSAIYHNTLGQLTSQKKTSVELHLGVKKFLNSWHLKVQDLEKELKSNKELLASKTATRCEYTNLFRHYRDMATFTRFETAISYAQDVQNRVYCGLNKEISALSASIIALEEQKQVCASELKLLQDFFEQEEQDWRLV